MTFTNETDFEQAVIDALTRKGWDPQVLKYPTEQDLIRNWADILFENNRGIDRLNDTPMTDGEMQQILEQITTLRTPLKLNGFINGKTVSITRDNPADKLHFGKEISLKIYDRMEIAAGQSRYQIAQQPIFQSKSKILNNRRGDLMLLINGMPVIHIELKKSGVSVTQAANQIEKYAHEGVFTGLFALVQVFVAMEPNETLYFANPGPDGKFNRDFFFHWADFNNEPINDWHRVVDTFLSIPEAHELIGFFGVADDADGILKVMRSYQIYAARKISDTVAKTHWDGRDRLGGYIWHTTGSGKTMTSFKSAQLIAGSRDADKVVFLMDRIELGTQSLNEYRAFADVGDEVQATEDTVTLISKLKSNDPANTLIVTSIQKMSNIKQEDGGSHAHDIELINRKRIVFIVDECHRSTNRASHLVYSDGGAKDVPGMLQTIKQTFPTAMLFGFSGTPRFDENHSTADIFGPELHRYTIADGIRDGNVLGFDPYMVLTFRDKDVRQAVALDKANAIDVNDAIKDPAKAKIFYRYMDASQVPMAGYTGDDGKRVNGIEDYLSHTQYSTDAHINAVIQDIGDNFTVLSHGGKFHAIFATASIPEAIEYYRRMKTQLSQLKITALFDPNIDNDGKAQLSKEDGLVEIITDYNARYGQDFSLRSFAKMKKDIAARLAHKAPYQMISRTPDLQLDLLIVVDQMLTGYDSKWVNTLYMDKLMEGANIIQAFSRTNRLLGSDKPHGVIRYYRKPHTMARRIEKAFKDYSGERPYGLFVEKLEHNVREINRLFGEIEQLFISAGIPDFERTPAEASEKAKFAALFRDLNQVLESAKVQGFVWDKDEYVFEHSGGTPNEHIRLACDENTYLILALRYKELFTPDDGESGEDIPYEIDSHLTEIDTGKIDADYMNTRFEKFLRCLEQTGVDPLEVQRTLDDLHKSFAALTQEEQKYANLFLHDVQSGVAHMTPGKSFRDYVTEYLCRAKNNQVHKLAECLGLDENKLRDMMNTGVTEATLNAFGRFDDLKNSIDKAKAADYFARIEGKRLPPPKVAIRIDKMLREFILKGGIDIG